MNNIQVWNKSDRKVAVIGLGYVGLPIAVAFSKRIGTIGFDINKKKIESYQAGIDVTGEVEEDIKQVAIEFTSAEERIREADYIIVAVPTPVYPDHTPDLQPLISACKCVGRNLKEGAIIIFESTVYPGVTEDICIPILEKESGLIAGNSFKVGYSPERINPGDKVHKLESVVKVVSGMDEETTEKVAALYELIITAGVYRAPSIKVAEAAKIAENSQRDINIAFMNELAIIFEKLGITTKDVIDAMNTKWNALGFYPGLVGGHCIGVDPYYLVHKGKCLGYYSKIIEAGRKMNDSMGSFIVCHIIKELIKANLLIQEAKIYIMGITFKENCSDSRNSKVIDILKGLQSYGIDVKVVDEVANQDEVRELYGLQLISVNEVREADCLIFAVAHDAFKRLSLLELDSMYKAEAPKVIIDVKSIFDRRQLESKGYQYWSL